MKEISTIQMEIWKRRTTLLIFSLFFLNLTFAQVDDYRPMLEDMKTWEYEYHHFDEVDEEEMDDSESGVKETIYTVRYFLSGDTVINGIGYHKMYREVDGRPTYYAAYREEGLKVYKRSPQVLPEDERDIIVADFEYDGLYDPYDVDLDEYDMEILSSITDSIDLVEVNGLIYRRHTYYDAYGWILAIGVEGVGYRGCGMRNYPSAFPAEPDCYCDYEVFTACYDKDGNVFRASDFTKEGMKEVSSIMGDVNGDGAVTIADVTMMVAYVLGEPQTGFIVTNADVNGDGNITITDVSEIVGLILDVKDMERPTYVPFVEEGKTWYCGYWHPYANFPSTPEDPGGEGIDCIFTICGDTLVNGKDYKKVYCQFEEYYGDNEQHYYCAVREEAYRVFIMEEGTTEEKLLYDFSRPNEMITLNYDDYRFARSKGVHRDDFLPGQLEYHVYKFTEDGEVDYINDSSSWIDGVGDYLTNPFAFEFTFLPYGEPKFGKDISVITCMKDGKYIFNNEWMAVPQYAPGATSFTAQKHME